MTTDTESKETESKKEIVSVKNKSSTGLEENLGGLLAYAFTFISGIILFLIEKENEYIRFHALQSIFTFGGLMVAFMVLSFIPFIGWIISILFTPVWVVLWIFMMYKGYQGTKYKLPIVGEMVEKQLAKQS